MKYQALFSLKNNEKISMNVVCCSRYLRFKGLSMLDLNGKKRSYKFKVMLYIEINVCNQQYRIITLSER